ncbi:MAG TPA: hypothetical protein VG756_27930 [Pseudonocardiaceae bacterium]|jgi:hypothetical protein|nr:hypothetical protein [Pseudonocardiaceae bacterium]
MERDSNLHSPRADEELEHELHGTLQANRSSHAEEWRDPELPAEDDDVPQVGEVHRSEADGPEAATAYQTETEPPASG